MMSSRLLQFVKLSPLVAMALIVVSVFLPGCAGAPPKGAPAKPTAKKTARSHGASPQEARLAPKKHPELSEAARIEAYSRFAAGIAHELNNEPKQALDDFERSALANPGYEPVVLDVVKRLLRLQQPDRAIQVLTNSLAAPSASGGLYAWLGLAYAQAGKGDLAIQANRSAIRSTPRNLAAYQNLCQLFLQQSLTNEARHVMEEAALQKGVDAEFLVGLAEAYLRFGRDKLFSDEETQKRSLDALDRAAKASPSNPLTVQKIADGFFLHAEFLKAEPFYVRLLADFPDLPFIRQKLANIYLRTKQKEKATAQLEAIRRENPTDPQTYLFLGALAADEEKPEEAADYYQTALRLNPEIEQLYYDLALLKISMKKRKEAMDLIETARSRFKLNFLLEFYTGVVCGANENYKDALAHFTSAELIAKTSETNRLTHYLYYQLGSSSERIGDRDQAEKYFRKCLELTPDYAAAMNYMGYMWAEKGIRLEEAHELIRKAVNLDPKNAAFLDSLGWVLFKMDKPEEALTYMQQAIEQSKEADPTLYDHLGDIYETLKQPDRAKDAWERSIKAEANEEVKKKIERINTRSR